MSHPHHGSALSTRMRATALLLAIVLAGCASVGAAPGGRHVTQGLATVVVADLYSGCKDRPENLRKAPIGEITASDGTHLIVPARTAFGSGPRATPLYDQCDQVRPARLADVDLQKVPIVDIDPDGEVVTGFIVADNYFELYVNGRPVAIDPVPYTPFNSSVVRFRVKKPYTYAVRLVDWEEKLGLGMEWFPPNHDWWIGDGGFIARFSDGVVTDASWRAQSFYISPLTSPSEVVENGPIHDTPSLGKTIPLASAPTCQERCYAVHYDVPANWNAPDFADGGWPQAFEYTDEQVGMGPALVAYTRFREAFAGARWIWSRNLVFDNHVLVRKTVH